MQRIKPKIETHIMKKMTADKRNVRQEVKWFLFPIIKKTGQVVYYNKDDVEAIVNNIKSQLHKRGVSGIMRVNLYTDQGLKCNPTNYFDIDNKNFILKEVEYMEMVDIEYLHDHIMYFHIYTMKNKPAAGGADKYNNCGFYTLVDCGVKKWKHPSELKHFLGIPFNAMIEIKHWDKIEKSANVGIFIHCDYQRTPKIDAKRNIHIKLLDEHYSPYINLNNKNIIFKYNKEAEIRVYSKIKGVMTYYDGETTTTSENKERNNKYIDIKYDNIKKRVDDKWVKIDTLEEAHKEAVKQAEQCKKYSSINIYKSGWVNRTFLYYFFWELEKVGIKLEDIEPYEVPFLEGATCGAYMFVEKGQYKKVYDYDRKCHYSSVLTDNKLFLPIGKGILGHKTTENIEKSTNNRFSYGIYKCQIEYKEEYKNKFRYNNIKGYYTHVSLATAYDLGLKITMADEIYNFIGYPLSEKLLVKAHIMFDNLTRWFYGLKKEHSDVYFFKSLLSTNWGVLSQYKKKFNKSKDGEVTLEEDDKIHSAEHNGKYAEYVTVSSLNPYKYATGRWKPFVLDYGRRYMFVNVLQKYDSIVKMNTDGFLSTKKISEFENNKGNIGDIVNVGEYKNIELINMTLSKHHA